jgi:hypothetical protein
MTPNVIPITPLYLRYRALRSADQAERLRYARDVLANPAWLAEEFVTTVLRFGEYDNADQHFYSKRDAHTFGASLEATKDLVLRLEALPSVTAVDAGDRQIGGTGHPDVTDVPAPDLAFEYVDRELLLQRTESPAKWENGAVNRGGIRPDILLADLQTRTPIVAELKLPGDMDPFLRSCKRSRVLPTSPPPRSTSGCETTSSAANSRRSARPRGSTFSRCSSAGPRGQTSPTSCEPPRRYRHSCSPTTDSQGRSGASPASASPSALATRSPQRCSSHGNGPMTTAD